MIAFLRGAVAARGPGWVEVDVGGIGFHLTISAHAAAGLPAPGVQVRLPTRLVVREDGVTLFGFSDEAERDAFAALDSVAGVGSKLAVAVLSKFTPEAFAYAIATEDVAALCAVPGVGKKTAQRLILELKDRLAVPGGPLGPTGSPAVAGNAGSGPEEEAHAALLALGYAGSQAAAAIAAIRDATAPAAPALVRAALRELGGRR